MKSPTGSLTKVNPSKPKKQKQPKLDYNKGKAPSVINFKQENTNGES